MRGPGPRGGRPVCRGSGGGGWPCGVGGRSRTAGGREAPPRSCSPWPGHTDSAARRSCSLSLDGADTVSCEKLTDETENWN